MLETLARATVSMTEAEVFQLERKRSGQHRRRPTTCGSSPRRRPPSCRRAAGSAGCWVAADAEQVEGPTRYGLDIGIAFQISDDSLDFVADQARLGKAVGADLKEGKRTLPLIATFERAGPADRDRIQALLRQPALSPDEIEEIRRLVVKHAGVEYALERAHQYAQSAKDALRPFPDSEDKETLVLVADFVVDRDR